MGGVTRNSWALSSELVSDLCYMIVTMKYLTAKQKAEELGITLSGLRKTRHLYKHIPKGPRKYLYFAEDPQEGDALNQSNCSPWYPPKSPRHRRRDVPFGQENYHKCNSGSGDKLKLYNQMRSKMALEGGLSKEEQESLTTALAYKVKENHKEIVEQKRAQRISEIQQEDERQRRKDPRRCGHFNPRGRLITFSTNWNEIFPREKDEYELALEELGENSSEKKYYW